VADGCVPHTAAQHHGTRCTRARAAAAAAAHRRRPPPPPTAAAHRRRPPPPPTAAAHRRRRRVICAGGPKRHQADSSKRSIPLTWHTMNTSTPLASEDAASQAPLDPRRDIQPWSCLEIPVCLPSPMHVLLKSIVLHCHTAPSTDADTQILHRLFQQLVAATDSALRSKSCSDPLTTSDFSHLFGMLVESTNLHFQGRPRIMFSSQDVGIQSAAAAPPPAASSRASRVSSSCFLRTRTEQRTCHRPQPSSWVLTITPRRRCASDFST
jgi:hypothetical protein